ncbi:MAG: hypothetical protein ABSE48_21810 [Verrucomicrobiota bacterium]
MKVKEARMPKEKLAEFYAANDEMRHFQKRPVLGKCMFWSGNCEAPPIRSHLLARSWLEQISDNTNHIIQLELTTENLSNQPARIAPRRLGINQATTFPGFCEKHDNEMFSCLEKKPFTASQEQLIALRYRSVCREACVKHQVVSCNLPRASDQAAPPHFSMHFAAEMKRCTDLLMEKDVLEESMRDGVNPTESYVIKFAKKPTVLASSTIYPLSTFTGRTLDFRQEWITISVIPDETGGWAIFSWSKKMPKNASLLAKSFAKISNKNQTAALLNFVFEVSENHAISPTWWASLTDHQQGDIMKRFERSLTIRGDNRPPPKTLLVSGKPWADWQPVTAGYYQ